MYMILVVNVDHDTLYNYVYVYVVFCLKRRVYSFIVCSFWFVFVCLVFSACLSSFVSFSFSFLEFINGVCGLRWM